MLHFLLLFCIAVMLKPVLTISNELADVTEGDGWFGCLTILKFDKT